MQDLDDYYRYRDSSRPPSGDPTMAGTLKEKLEPEVTPSKADERAATSKVEGEGTPTEISRKTSGEGDHPPSVAPKPEATPSMPDIAIPSSPTATPEPRTYTREDVAAQRETVAKIKSQLKELTPSEVKSRIEVAEKDEQPIRAKFIAAEEELEKLAKRLKISPGDVDLETISIKEIEEIRGANLSENAKEGFLQRQQELVTAREALRVAEEKVHAVKRQRSRLEQELEVEIEKLDQLREARGTQSEDWSTKKRNMGEDYRNPDPDGLPQFETALKERITAEITNPTLRDQQEQGAAILRRWGQAIKQLHERMSTEQQQKFIDQLTKRLKTLSDDVSKPAYDDFRRWLRNEILDHVMRQEQLKRFNELNHFLYSRTKGDQLILPDSGSIGEFFHQFRERDVATRYKETNGETKVNTLSAKELGGRTVLVEGSTEAIGGVQRKADGFVHVEDAIADGPKAKGDYLAEDKSGHWCSPVQFQKSLIP